LKKSYYFLVCGLLSILLSACSDDELAKKNKSLELELSNANKKIDEEKQIITNQNSQIDKFLNQDKFALKDGIDNSILEENVDYYEGARWSSDVFLYSGYIRAMLQRTLFDNNYIAIKGSKIDVNPVENLIGREEMKRKIIGIKFIKPISSKVNALPNDIQEVWYSTNPTNSKHNIFLITSNKEFYSYEVQDDNLIHDFEILNSILTSFDKYNIENNHG
jgi:hypothetical protein